MELRITVINCSTNKGEENSICEKVRECQNPPKKNIVHHGEDSDQIDKNENNNKN